VPVLVGVQCDKHLIENYYPYPVAGGFEHEVRAILVEQLRSEVDDVSLLG
jgi:hypothetical protein